MSPIGRTDSKLSTAPTLAPIPVAEVHVGRAHLGGHARKVNIIQGDGRLQIETDEVEDEATELNLVHVTDEVAKAGIAAVFAPRRVSPIKPLLSSEAIAKEVAAQLRKTYLVNQSTLLIHQENIPINKLYTSVQIIVVGEPEKKEKEAGKTKTSLYKETIELENLFKYSKLITASQKRVLIKGVAGVGKTTLCSYIAYGWATEKLFKEFEYLFWLPICKLNKEECPPNSEPLLKGKIPPYLSHYLSKVCYVEREHIQTFLENEELRDKTLILLDGYDELSPDAASPKGHLHSTLCHLKAFPHVLITTRPQPVDFNPVCSLEILGFDAKGVEEYVDKFFQEDKKKAQDLRQYLREPLIGSLAGIPINLEIFCSLIAAGKPLGGSGVPTMTALYIQLTDWMFKRFRIDHSSELNNPLEVIEESEPRHAQDVEPLAEALEEIAWTAVEQNMFNLKEQVITPIFRKVDNKMRLGDIRRIGPLRIENGEGSFIHPTLREFFAAARFARLYASNPEEAKMQLRRIKFKPRYQPVLAMTAGYLSSNLSKTSEKRTSVETFFNDLFSEPYDLAVGSELNLFARCFEECQAPDKIKQWPGFIDLVDFYIKKVLSKNLIIELLSRSPHLLHHQAILKVVKDGLGSDKEEDRNRYLSIIENVANKWQGFPLEELETTFLDLLQKRVAIEAVVNILSLRIEIGKIVPPRIVTVLIDVVGDPNVESGIRQRVIFRLMKMVEIDLKNAGPVINKFISFLDVSNTDSLVLGEAADALRGLVFAGGELPKGTIQKLIHVLTIPKLKPPSGSRYLPIFDQFARQKVVGALIEIASKRSEQEVRQALLHLLSDHETRYSERAVIEALVEIAKQSSESAQEVVFGLKKVLRNSESPQDCITANKTLSRILREIPSQLQAAVQLVETLKTYLNSIDVQESAITALSEIAKAGEEGARATGDILVGILLDPSQSNFYLLNQAALTLGEIAKKGEKVPPMSVQALVSLLCDFKAVGNIEDVANYHPGLKAIDVLNTGVLALEEIVNTLEVSEALEKELGNLLSKIFNIKMFPGNQPFKRVQKAVVRILKKIDPQGTKLPENVKSLLTLLSSDPLAHYNAQPHQKAVTEQATKAKDKIPKKVSQELLEMLNYPNPSSEVQQQVVIGLRERAGRSGKISKKVFQGVVNRPNDPMVGSSSLSIDEKKEVPLIGLKALMQLFKNPELNDDERGVVADVMREVVKAGVRENVVEVGSELMFEFSIPYHSPLEIVADILAEICKCDGEFFKRVVQRMTAIISDPKEDDYAQKNAIQTLGLIPYSNLVTLAHDPTFVSFVIRTCFLTNRAFLYLGGRFLTDENLITDSNDPLLDKGDNPQFKTIEDIGLWRKKLLESAFRKGDGLSPSSIFD